MKTQTEGWIEESTKGQTERRTEEREDVCRETMKGKRKVRMNRKRDI